MKQSQIFSQNGHHCAGNIFRRTMKYCNIRRIGVKTTMRLESNSRQKWDI